MPTTRYEQHLLRTHVSRWKLYLASLRLQAICNQLTKNQLLIAAGQMTRDAHGLAADADISSYNAEVRSLNALMARMADVQALTIICQSPFENEQLVALIEGLLNERAVELPKKPNVSARRTDAQRAMRAATERQRRAAKRAVREERTDLPSFQVAKALIPIVPDVHSGRTGRGSFTPAERMAMAADELQRAEAERLKLEAQRGTSMFGT